MSSMEILRECYRQDRRKAYHAVAFGDQALRFDDRFGLDDSNEYLTTAAQWLKQEEIRSPWNRGVKRVAQLVERRLRSRH